MRDEAKDEAGTPEDLQGARKGVNGLLVLFGIVLIGLGSGAAYYAYKRPLLEKERAAILAAAPTTAAGRLEQWMIYGVPQVHHRLAEVARFSTESPWLVTHRIQDPEGGPGEVWGIDCEAIPQSLARIEDMTVVIELPPPVLLGRVDLDASQSRHVPTYASSDLVTDPEGRLIELATFFLERIPAGLERDIPGARIEVRVVSSPPTAD